MKQLPKDNAFKIIKKSIAKQQVIPTLSSTASATVVSRRGFETGAAVLDILCRPVELEKKPNSDNFLPEATFGLGVLSLPAFVCVCVRVLSVCQPRGCQRDNFWPIHPRITKFTPAVKNTLLKIPIVSGAIDYDLQGQIAKSKFTLFWACPHHKSSSVQARITKIKPDVQNPLVKIPIVFEIDVGLRDQIDVKSKFHECLFCSLEILHDSHVKIS